MSKHDEEVLRILNGESVEGWCKGAAFNVCATWLRRNGYVDTSHRLTTKGSNYLKEVE